MMTRSLGFRVGAADAADAADAAESATGKTIRPAIAKAGNFIMASGASDLSPSELLGFQARCPSDPREQGRMDFFTVVEGEDKVRPSHAFERAMRPPLPPRRAFGTPSDAEECPVTPPSLASGPARFV